MDKYNVEPIKACKETMYNFSLDTVTDIAEIGLDAFLEDGFLKEVPVFGIAYRFGQGVKSVYDAIIAKRVMVFIQQVQSRDIEYNTLKKHIDDLHHNQNKLNNEIEVVLDYLAKQTAYAKSKILGNFYFHYLSNTITWDEFGLLADITNSVSVCDFNLLLDLFQEKEYFDSDHFELGAAKRLDTCSLIDFFNGMVVSSPSLQGKSIMARINNVGEAFCKLGLEDAWENDKGPQPGR